uniref:Mab-21 domain-containing protein n=1 Tax=Panagrellus redivivus TaxID=6233 RepID=A0A7E4VB11_PANRE
MEIDASTVNFVFTCRKLPEMLIWRLDNPVFEPELEPYECYFLLETLPKLVSSKWEIATVNCDAKVTKVVTTIMNQFDIPTVERVKKLQTAIRCSYPNWRVCWYETKRSTDKTDPQLGHFTVPCVIYKRGANGYFWYLAFYAPLEWSNEVLDNTYYDCDEDSDEVERRLDDIDTNIYNNNLNAVEQNLNSKLSFPISLFFHQTAAGLHNRVILARHREAYRSVNVDLEYMCQKLFLTAVKVMQEEESEPFLTVLHAVRQVLEKHGFDKNGKAMPSYSVIPTTISTAHTVIKQMLRGIDHNKHTNKVYAVIYCNRNAVVSFQDAKIVVIGPFKIVVVVR